jgi:hypothetical protein
MYVFLYEKHVASDKTYLYSSIERAVVLIRMLKKQESRIKEDEEAASTRGKLYIFVAS